jgi:hypothetical protein
MIPMTRDQARRRRRIGVIHFGVNLLGDGDWFIVTEMQIQSAL